MANIDEHLKAQMETIASPPRRGLGRRIAPAIAALVLLGLIAWAIFGRRQSALDQWMAEMRAKGEKLTLEELGLNRPARTNQAMEVIEVAASRFKAFERAKLSARFLPAEEFGAGERRVAWAGTNLHSVKGYVFDWGAFERELTELRTVLASVQEILRDPPLDSGRDYTGGVRTVSLVAVREVAQSIHDITMYDLRQGDLSHVHQDLLALIGMSHLHAETWTLVDQMIRSAIAGLAVDAVWNALQASGWSDKQLAEIQANLATLSFFKELAQSYRAERATGLHWFTEIKTNRNAASFRRLANLPDHAMEFFWRSFWAEGDFLLYCRHYESLIGAAHALTETRSYHPIARQIAEEHNRLDRALSGLRKYRYLWSSIAIPNTGRMMDRLVESEVSRQLAITAIALKRYELRHGRLPGELRELEPDFLGAVPVDYMNGQPLHYRRQPDGSFHLYSVGLDGVDDGGSSLPVVAWKRSTSFWSGRDTVWPQPASSEAAMAAPPAEVFPLIEFEDAPLLQVVELLARQAKLQVQVDPDVLKQPLPGVSIRLKNMTLTEALQTILGSNNLVLVKHAGTNLVGITFK